MHPIARHPFACAALIALLVCILAGCKEDNPAPNAPGYYSGPMKAKSTSSTKSDDSGPSTPQSNTGKPKL